MSITFTNAYPIVCSCGSSLWQLYLHLQESAAVLQVHSANTGGQPAGVRRLEPGEL